MNQFLRDLQTGKEKEKLFEDKLKNLGLQTENTSKLSLYPFYDIKATGGTKTHHARLISTYEVKSNDAAAKYDNIGVELSKTYDGKYEDSGLSITQADYYVFVETGNPDFYLIRTKKLKELVKKNKFHNIIDYNNYLMCYFKKDFLKQYIVTL